MKLVAADIHVDKRQAEVLLRALVCSWAKDAQTIVERVAAGTMTIIDANPAIETVLLRMLRGETLDEVPIPVRLSLGRPDACRIRAVDAIRVLVKTDLRNAKRIMESALAGATTEFLVSGQHAAQALEIRLAELGWKVQDLSRTRSQVNTNTNWS